jgi:4-hydroxymandelate oxidase
MGDSGARPVCLISYQNKSNMPAWLTLNDLALTAEGALDPATWAYFSGGAADEITLRDNAAAWQALRLWPRVLRPLAGGHTRTQLGCHALPHPILLAPVAHQQLAHPDGEWASALAAAAQGAGFVLATQSNVPMERIAESVLADPGRGPLWFQLYWQADRGFNRALVQRAEAAGFEAIVLTVDAPLQGLRDRELRAGFALPPGHTRLPVWLKGVLHPLDARQAQALQVAGLIVSNHGGRTLDTAPPTAQALPLVRDAVGREMPLIVDGGIRRGTDVLKAIALGAQAVMIGRPDVHALAAGGPLAVARTIRLLRDELEMAMALTGCRTLGDAGPALLDPTLSADNAKKPYHQDWD